LNGCGQVFDLTTQQNWFTLTFLTPFAFFFHRVFILDSFVVELHSAQSQQRAIADGLMYSTVWCLKLKKNSLLPFVVFTF
jgi:hypothetical protein